MRKLLETMGLCVSNEERESRRRLHEAEDRAVGAPWPCDTTHNIEDRFGKNYQQFLRQSLREAEEHCVGGCSCFRGY
jgi:hypothetical protein